MKHFTRKANFDAHTFGDSPAEVNLARILSEPGSHRVAHKVGNVISKVDRVLNLLTIQDERTSRFVLLILRQYFKQLVSETFKDNQTIKTHVLNVIAKRFRQKLARSKT